jgi:hypothetical protein
MPIQSLRCSFRKWRKQGILTQWKFIKKTIFRGRYFRNGNDADPLLGLARAPTGWYFEARLITSPPSQDEKGPWLKSFNGSEEWLKQGVYAKCTSQTSSVDYHVYWFIPIQSLRCSFRKWRKQGILAQLKFIKKTIFRGRHFRNGSEAEPPLGLARAPYDWYFETRPSTLPPSRDGKEHSTAMH